MRYLFFVLILFVFTQCEKFPMDRRYSLYLKNNADYPIVYFTAININPLPSVYPDTTLRSDSLLMEAKIQSGENMDLWARDVRIKDLFDDLPGDTLSIYLFHIDTLKNNTWADVQAGYKILKRYDLSLEDLEHLDYKLNYPPDAKMSGVKMYPPYP